VRIDRLARIRPTGFGSWHASQPFGVSEDAQKAPAALLPPSPAKGPTSIFRRRALRPAMLPLFAET
jgi:hypothetical protein